MTFYLSTDTDITTSDRSIGTRTHSLDANTYTSPTTTLTVPADMPIGTYYVGWIMSDGTTEYTTSNNTAVISDETLSVITSSCSSGTALGDDEFSLNTVRRFRDRVLASNTVGQGLIDGYYAHDGEVVRILLSRPRLLKQATRLLYAFMPELRRLGFGKPVRVTQTKVEGIMAFLDALHAAASPALQEFLDQVQVQLTDETGLAGFGVTVTRN